MPTKKKVVLKKKVVKKAAKVTAGPARTAVAVPVTDVFSTVPASPETVSVPRSSVLLFVNGKDKGTIDTQGQSLGAFVTARAQHAGIRTFSVYIDGRKADTSDAKLSLSNISKVEIVAKDARG